MALTQDQIQRARELAQARGSSLPTGATGSVSLLEKYGIGVQTPQTPSLRQKLSSRISNIAEEARQGFEKTSTEAELREEAGQQNPLSTGLQKFAAGAVAGTKTLLSPVTAVAGEVASDVGKTIQSGREIQRQRDQEAIAQGRITPEQALSNKPKIEEVIGKPIGEYIQSVGQGAEEQLSQISPEKRANLEALGGIVGAGFDVAGGLVGASVAKQGVKSLATKGMEAAQAIKQSGGVGKALYDYSQEKIKSGAVKELEDFMKSKKTLINQTNIAKQKGIDLVDELSDTSIYKNLKPENGRINAKPAIEVVEDRIEKAMDIKKGILPELDRFIPMVSKKDLRERAVKNIAGKFTPADEKSLIKRIDDQIEAMPEELSISQVDNFRAKFRQSARDAKDMQKSDSEYSALENAFRDKVFEVTDSLSFEGGKFKDLNNFIRKNITLKEFLEKSLDGQVVSGGKLGVLGGRLIGAVAGSSGGVLGTLAGAEGGTFISKIILDKQLGNSLKMRMIREVTDDPDIIREAEALLKNVRDYEIPQLPPRSMSDVQGTIKVAPEGTTGQFETTGLTPMVTPQVKKPSLPNNSGKNTITNTTSNVSNITETIPQKTKKATKVVEKSIPKELQPVAEEARKYKNVEDFVAAMKKFDFRETLGQDAFDKALARIQTDMPNPTAAGTREYVIDLWYKANNKVKPQPKVIVPKKPAPGEFNPEGIPF